MRLLIVFLGVVLLRPTVSQRDVSDIASATTFTRAPTSAPLSALEEAELEAEIAAISAAAAAAAVAATFSTYPTYPTYSSSYYTSSQDSCAGRCFETSTAYSAPSYYSSPTVGSAYYSSQPVYADPAYINAGCTYTPVPTFDPFFSSSYRSAEPDVFQRFFVDTSDSRQAKQADDTTIEDEPTPEPVTSVDDYYIDYAAFYDPYTNYLPSEPSPFASPYSSPYSDPDSTLYSDYAAYSEPNFYADPFAAYSDPYASLYSDPYAPFYDPCLSLGLPQTTFGTDYVQPLSTLPFSFGTYTTDNRQFDYTPGTCYCDVNCGIFNNCCLDFTDICAPLLYTAPESAYSYGADYGVPIPFSIPQEVPIPVVVEVPVPIPLTVDVSTQQAVPYSVLIENPVPYSVPVEIQVPVPEPVEVVQPVEVPYPVIVYEEVLVDVPYSVLVDALYPVDVPYPVAVENPVNIPVPYEVPVVVVVETSIPVPVPYEVVIENPVPFQEIVEVPVPVPLEVPQYVEVNQPYPVQIPIETFVDIPFPVPIETPIPVEVPVQVPVDNPVPYEVPVQLIIPVLQPYEVFIPVEVENVVEVDVYVDVPVEAPVEIPVEVAVPYAVEVLVDIPFASPYPIEVEVEVFVDFPYPVEVEQPVPIPNPFENPINIPVPYEVPVEIIIPIPQPYEVPFEVEVANPVPYPVQVDVPVMAAVGYQVYSCFQRCDEPRSFYEEPATFYNPLLPTLSGQYNNAGLISSTIYDPYATSQYTTYVRSADTGFRRLLDQGDDRQYYPDYNSFADYTNPSYIQPTCYCDSQCTQSFDCCEDYFAVCQASWQTINYLDFLSFSSIPAVTGTCLDRCGESFADAAGPVDDVCWCDDGCGATGTCCDDFYDVCG